MVALPIRCPARVVEPAGLVMAKAQAAARDKVLVREGV